jgi:hypothetical protein
MTGKNIKKSLNKKIENWLESVKDKKIEKTIRENAIITGGAIVSLLNGEEVNDYDVYFRTKEACFEVANYYAEIFNKSHGTSIVEIKDKSDRVQCFIRSSGVAGEPDADDEEPVAIDTEPSESKYKPVFFSTNAITLSDKIQLVVRFCGAPEEIHKNYDFVHCTCSYSFLDNKLDLPSRALEAIINKELFYIGSKYPLCSIIRSRKFIQRGWSINAGQYLKMCLQLNELDLKDLETFKDQLAGVDSFYFNCAIAQIEEMKKNNPDFKVDNSYLFEVINRIF